MLIEEWRSVTIHEFYGIYEISNLGRVRSVDRTVIGRNGCALRRQQQFIQPNYSGAGRKKYFSVSMSIGGKSGRALVHRLVALAFLPNPNNLAEVNHIDGIKTNNVVTNLEWSSGADNKRHASAMGLYVGSKPKLTDDDVVEVRRMFGDGKNRYEIARLFNVSASLIYIIVTNRHRVMPRPEVAYSVDY